MTKDNFSPRAPRLHAAFLARTASLALCAFALPAACFAATGSPTHPHTYARTHHHASYVAASSVSHRKPGHAATAHIESASARSTDRHAAAKAQATVPQTKHLSRRAARAQARKAAAAPPAKPVVTASTPTPQKQFAQDQQVAAVTPVREETLRGRIARFFFGPMRGSHESLVRQNQRAQQDGLTRVQDDADIARQVQTHSLVAIPNVAGLTVDERLPENRRYARPWTAQFLTDLARAHAARFNSDIQVNSAVRTVEFQKRLMHTNGNAAPASGDTASSHLMGTTIDLAKRNMSPQEVEWMRAWLWPLQQAGKIDVEEEFKQSCFHIAVYRSYAQQLPDHLLAANAHPRLRMVSPSAAEN
jgi:hypothetical protein